MDRSLARMKKKMEAKDVLKYYVDNCNNRADYFQFNLASNAVLDWFGRTFRGNKNIEQYLRLDVWPQYDQNFAAAVSCGPFENKPPHMQTRDTPTENVAVCAVPAVCSADAFDSPPRSNVIKADQPPPLTRGKRFLKTLEDDQLPPAKTKTYNLRRFNDDAKTKTNSPAKCEPKMCRKRTAQPNEYDEHESPTKRTKSTESVASISTPTKSTIRLLDAAYKQESTVRSAPSAPRIANSSNQIKYTDLQYLESIGSIRTIRRVKHPGINKVPSVNAAAAVTPFISPESQNGWDRKTKLKLSYRLNTSDTNDIQFALIIYEPLTMVTRRNLLEEFEKAARDEPSHSLSTNKIKSSTKLLKTRCKPKNDKLSTLRRLRF